MCPVFTHPSVHLVRLLSQGCMIVSPLLERPVPARGRAQSLIRMVTAQRWFCLSWPLLTVSGFDRFDFYPHNQVCSCSVVKCTQITWILFFVSSKAGEISDVILYAFLTHLPTEHCTIGCMNEEASLVRVQSQFCLNSFAIYNSVLSRDPVSQVTENLFKQLSSFLSGLDFLLDLEFC